MFEGDTRGKRFERFRDEVEAGKQRFHVRDSWGSVVIDKDRPAWSFYSTTRDGAIWAAMVLNLISSPLIDKAALTAEIGVEAGVRLLEILEDVQARIQEHLEENPHNPHLQELASDPYIFTNTKPPTIR